MKIKGFSSLKSTSAYKTIYLTMVLILSALPILSFAQVEVVDVGAIVNCRYLNDVEGSSGYGKNMNWQSLAKYSALNKAEELGASHVVWENFYPVGGFNGTVTGKAYICGS
jgi:hypothetical protein